MCDRAQVVGWPPIRSFRKNSMASIPSKKDDDAEGKMGAGCLYIKVSMDGAPYLRKVDLKTYGSYVDLSLALEKMFSCFTIGILSFLLLFVSVELPLWLPIYLSLHHGLVLPFRLESFRRKLGIRAQDQFLR